MTEHIRAVLQAPRPFPDLERRLAYVSAPVLTGFALTFVGLTIAGSSSGDLRVAVFLAVVAALVGAEIVTGRFNAPLVGLATAVGAVAVMPVLVESAWTGVGVAAAAVMIILPSYIFKDKDLHKVVIIGEVVAIGALVMCLMFVFVDLGGPLQAWHMIPGIGLFNWPTSLLTWDVLVLNG
mgnify:CR=1 FL=1